MVWIKICNYTKIYHKKGYKNKIITVKIVISNVDIA